KWHHLIDNAGVLSSLTTCGLHHGDAGAKLFGENAHVRLVRMLAVAAGHFMNFNSIPRCTVPAEVCVRFKQIGRRLLLKAEEGNPAVERPRPTAPERH